MAGSSRSALVLTDRQQEVRDVRADAVPEVHRVLLGKLFPRQASVLSGEQWGRGAG